MKWSLLVNLLGVFGLQDGPKVDISSENVAPNAKKSIWSYVFREKSTFWVILEANIAYTYAENPILQNSKRWNIFYTLGIFIFCIRVRNIRLQDAPKSGILSENVAPN